MTGSQFETADAAGPPYVLVAPTGARRNHGDHPALPITIDEIVETARTVALVGANGLHLHVRDDSGRHSLDSGRYLETLSELRRAVPDLDIQITTEAAGIFDVSAQHECLKKVQPDWASISVREVSRSSEIAPRVYGLCAEQGTRIQHILYDAGDVALLEEWQTSGIVREMQTDRLLVLGRYAAGQESVPQDINTFPINADSWMVCAFGAKEHDCLAHAAALGADVRVGFENSLTNSDGALWADNAASVASLMNTLRGART